METGKNISKFFYAGIITVILSTFFSSCKQTGCTEVISPDGNIKMIISIQDSVNYRVFYKGKEIVAASTISMELSDKVLGKNVVVRDIQYSEINETIYPLYGKFEKIDDKYNKVEVFFEGDYSLELRAHNEGAAYRFITSFDNDIIVVDEQAEVNIAGDPAVFFPETDNWTSWELQYIEYETVSSVAEDKKAITPVLFAYPEGIKLVVAESDVLSYPGMYLKKEDDNFKGAFAQYPDSTALGSWGFVSVVQSTRDYIAQTEGNRTFPWRIFIVTDDDKSLLTNEIIYKLADPHRITDTSWIKPGKAVWEWWHDAMLPGADIPSGMSNRNTALYKYYIDFAAENNIEYLMIDAGWSHIFDLSQINPRVDVQEIIRYGKSKNVGVFLWCVAMALTEETVDEYMKMMHDWGCVGLKVDFFDRDDQLVMDWYEMIARKGAEYQLMINYHGCSKPTGMQRTYPNIVNFEAVRGAECSKWDLTANPRHHLVFPFIRMLGGSLDYTPGSMRNRTRGNFRPVDPGLPYTQGTRCHELAMYVIYDQYFAMLCDSPEEYRKYPDILKFLSVVPVTFDDTKVLDAKVGEYALMAKRKGDEWFVGAMTDWTARSMTVDFSFLEKNENYIASVLSDGANANSNAEQYVFEEKRITADDVLDFNLAAGGGLVIHLKKIK